MSKPKILLSRKLPDVVETAVAQDFDVDLNETDQPMDRDTMRRALMKYDGILVTVTDDLQAETFAGLNPKTRILANYGVGFSHIDTRAAKAAGVTITNTPDVLDDCTADLAMTLLMMTARRAGEGERMVRANAWTGWRPTQLIGTSVTGKTLGIIGFGRIGQAMAQRAHFGFGMRILVQSRSQAAADILAKTGATQLKTLEELLPECDFVSLHCPGGDANRHLVNEARLRLMKPSAILVNTARGEVVDEAALVAALQTGGIAGAGLDVFENEPEIHPGLLVSDKAVLLPHLGSATRETRERMGLRAVKNLQQFFNGETPENLID